MTWSVFSTAHHLTGAQPPVLHVDPDGAVSAYTIDAYTNERIRVHRWLPGDMDTPIYLALATQFYQLYGWCP